MSETTAIVVSIVGSGIGIIGVMGVMIRILTANIGKQFDASAAQMREMKADLSARIDETNKRIDDTNRRFDSLTSEIHQRFDRVHRAVNPDSPTASEWPGRGRQEQREADTRNADSAQRRWRPPTAGPPTSPMTTRSRELLTLNRDRA